MRKKKFPELWKLKFFLIFKKSEKINFSKKGQNQFFFKVSKKIFLLKLFKIITGKKFKKKFVKKKFLVEKSDFVFLRFLTKFKSYLGYRK